MIGVAAIPYFDYFLVFLGVQPEQAPEGQHQGEPVLQVFTHLGGIARPPGGDDGEALPMTEIDQDPIRDLDAGLLP